MSTAKTRVTELELGILQHVWKLDNRATVNAIIENWAEKDVPGYTTVLKTLQKMEAKGIVGHEREGKRYLYTSHLTKEQITTSRLGSIINKIFSGNSVAFAEYFINSEKFTKDDLKKLRKMIDKKAKEMDR